MSTDCYPIPVTPSALLTFSYSGAKMLHQGNKTLPAKTQKYTKFYTLHLPKYTV